MTHYQWPEQLVESMTVTKEEFKYVCSKANPPFYNLSWFNHRIMLIRVDYLYYKQQIIRHRMDKTVEDALR